MGRQINRLPTSVVSHLRSSTILCNVAQIAEELVCNSLDAGATLIEIAVDGEACHMRVDDNGCGISRDDLNLVGERHATSKLHCLEELDAGVATLGFRGEALSSLCDVALVEITSRCRGMPNTYSKILKGSTTVSMGLSGEQRAHGTTVIARDMFYNQPVRRRLLKSSHRKTLQSVKESVLHFVLIHPQVSFTVKDLARKVVLLHTRNAATLKSTLRDTFGEDMLKRMQELHYAQGHFQLAGFLSKTYHSHSSKALQYFYINRRFVLKTALHKLVNSWVGPNISSHTGKGKDPLGQIQHDAEKGGKTETASAKHLYPTFVLNMTCPSSDYDITFEASKTLVEFKDWMPVTSFVRSILQESWGDQSISKKYGGFQALERSYQDPLKNENNGNIRQHNSAKHNTTFPSIAVRRALVDSFSRDPSHSNEHLIFQDKAACSSDEIPERAETTSRSSLSSLRGKEMIGVPKQFVKNSEDKQRPKIAEKPQTDRNADNDGAALSNWLMTPCRQQGTSEPFSTILGSDWFSDGVLSSKSKEKHLSLSGTVASTPLFRSDEISAKNDHSISSSVSSRMWVPSNNSSPTDTFGNPIWQSMEKSRSPDWGITFPGDDDGTSYLSPIEDTDGKDDKKWWETDNSKLKRTVWSGSDDSIGSSRILDTADFLPGVSSCLEGVSNVSNEVHLLVEGEWAEFDSDYSDSEMTWMPSGQTKRQKLKCVESLDSDIDDCFSTRLRTFSPYPAIYLGRTCSKLDIPEVSEDTENTGGPLSETFSPDTEYHLEAVQDQDFDTDVNSDKLQSNRKLDLSFDSGFDNLKLHTESQEQNPGNEEIVYHVSSPSRERHPGRGYSGPPFYRPPKRHGVHMNPVSSRSTVNRIVSVAEDTEVLQITADPRIDAPPKSPRKSNQTRDVLRKGMEHFTTSHSEEPGRCFAGHCILDRQIRPNSAATECPSLLSFLKATTCLLSFESSLIAATAIFQPTPSMDQDQMGKQRTATDTEDAECPTEVVKSTQPTLELDLVHHSKYRSTDGNSTGIEGADPPMDTVRAMFKEWSNPCMKKDDDILDISSGLLASSNSPLLPASITKDVLKHARVLKQVDTKFIASVSCGVLILIDQHAADERVRLEELREDVLGEHYKKQISLLASSQEIAVTISEQEVLQTYCQQIQDWGWRFKLPTGQRTYSSGMCKLLLSAVPSILGVSLTAADLTEYLGQLTDTQGSSAPPPAVIRLLNYKACRGAIMFGDTLLPAECSQLVQQLKKTRLCFQCAHGRPTMVPLVDLQALHKRFNHSFGSSSRKVGNIKSDRGPWLPGPKVGAESCGRWHGLEADVKPSLERAQARLGQARGV